MTLAGFCPICVQDALCYHLVSRYVQLTFLGREDSLWLEREKLPVVG
jgi:hypothetical protein